MQPTRVDQVTRDVTTAWLTLAEVRSHLNLFDDTSQDTMLAALEIATRMSIEDYLGMSIFAIQYRAYYPMPLIGTAQNLALPEVSPTTTINSVSYYNSTPALVALDSGLYYYDATGSQIIVSGFPDGINTVMTAPVVALYTTAANPLAAYPVIKQAGLLMLTHLYNNRSETLAGGLSKIPFGVDCLLRSYKPLVL